LSDTASLPLGMIGLSDGLKLEGFRISARWVVTQAGLTL